MINFTKKVLFAGALAMMMTPASAQLSNRSVVKDPSATVASMMKAPKSVKNTSGVRLANIAPSDYGKEVDIVTENFSKMTTGSKDDPDWNTVLNDYESADNAWINMINDYTNTPGWCTSP